LSKPSYLLLYEHSQSGGPI